MSDYISRQAAIRWVKTECNPYGKPTLDFESGKKVIEHLEQMPSAHPERTRMSNKEWIDFLVVQFDISRTSAKEMLHGMMKMKKEDNFKRDFNPLKQECESVEILEVQDG